MFPLMIPMFPWIPNLYKLQNDYPEPPTIYSLLNSYVNYGKPKEERKPIKDLAKYGRSMFFYTNYPLSENISKEDFEVMILNHFLMRRIGFDTVNAFSIRLINKLCEIMPDYNKMFDALSDWNIFNDGEEVNRTLASTKTGATTDSISNLGTVDNRYSDTPQTNLTNVKDGTYVTDYTFNQTESTTNSEGSSTNLDSTNETIKRSPSDKIKIYNEFIKNRNHIYSMIFEELESLFYQNVLI